MREKWCRVLGKKVHYWEAGEGPPLLLLPSAAGRAAEYHALMPLLEDAVHVFALDYPGFGQSDECRNLRSLDDLAVFIGEWRKALSLENCDIAGFSMGGWLALKMVLSQAQGIDRLILIATAAGEDSNVPIMSPLGLSFDEILDQFYFRPEVKERLARQKLSPETKKEIHRSSRAFECLAKAGALIPNLQDKLHEIKIPTLVVAGIEDRSMPLFYQKQLHENIPNSALCVFQNCGHAVITECTSELADAMRTFLLKN